ncbi:MAG: lysophospholipase [Gammaproteobacteria bacterium]|nr:lysophospholipase [Gammaproteobacteria bacterium]
MNTTPPVQHAMRIMRSIATVVGVLLLTIYFGWAFESRNMLQLGPEHRIQLEHEFRASQEDETDWAGYLEIEERLAAELAEKIIDIDRPDSLVDRYSTGSLSNPARFPADWNRSYQTTVPSARGVAVLLHGLSDSPYSMLATAQTLAGAGYNVVVPRMPGHGFAVGGLLQARWEDWTAAVRIAMRHAASMPGAEQSLLIAGYSNGGLLAIDYALECDDLDDAPCPDGIVLMSPAIAVSGAAIVTKLHPVLSWMPYFKQFQWLSILPEIDPFKFTSFPKRAAWEIYRVSRRTHKQLANPAEVAKLPPMLTFQSVVDNTVTARAIVTLLYDRLPANSSRLVVYDINRNSTALHLMRTQPLDVMEYFESTAPHDFSITLLRNRDRSTNELDAYTLPAGEAGAAAESTSLAWPTGIYSLSHIAIPFRPDDVVYGDGTANNDDDLKLGALAPRGEAGVLMLTPDFFLRTRHNPFYAYQAKALTEWIDTLQTP